MIQNLTPAAADWNAIPGIGEQQPRAFAYRLKGDRGDRPHRIAAWRGEPGTYRRDGGMPWSETFVVYKGKGRITVGDDVIDLFPGAIVDLPVGKPYVMEIVETVEKMAVITEAEKA
ncbi:cupin domain-containing protein [Reyranella sp. CPCC 100927]|uniref:cupin domain-containing protein n=1 Tax=Reyranella sp. CPCC 100927 TaxID=2599616 RepID=UPI0011B3E0F8|nr:cupin domain-containing protein [Reyranella sp. CPCC 100927]TWT01175.1 hypothetical protein FQU96_32330 [Reyranella sp. CPCC 100927]